MGAGAMISRGCRGGGGFLRRRASAGASRAAYGAATAWCPNTCASTCHTAAAIPTTAAGLGVVQLHGIQTAAAFPSAARVAHGPDSVDSLAPAKSPGTGAVTASAPVAAACAARRARACLVNGACQHASAAAPMRLPP